jgi:ABC-type transporter Mla subunit MlaD
MTRTEFNPAKLGAFVLGALLLAVLAVILWGPLNGVWEKRYVIFFDETATGLDPGATVRLNGVSIGRVDSIDLFYDQTNKVYSAVVVKLDRDRVKRISKGGQSFDDMLRGREVSAQLGISGLVSFKLYVDLKIEPLRAYEYRTWKNSEYQKYYGDDEWIPARESTIAKVIEKLEDVVNSAGITNLLGSVGKILDESATNHLVFKASAAIEAIRVLATNANELLLTNRLQIAMAVSQIAELASNTAPKLDKTFAKLDGAADSVQTNLAAFGADMDLIVTNFASIRTNLEARSAELGVLLRGAAPLPPQAAEDLRSLQDTLQSLQRLIEYVERHPESLARGRATDK